MTKLCIIADEIASKCPHAALQLRKLSRSIVFLPTWETLKAYHLQMCPVALGRSSEVQKDYIVSAIAENQVERVARLRREIDPKKKYKLCRNPFPYQLATRDDGRPIEHWLFWTSGQHTMDEALDIARVELSSKELIVTCNATIHKSIPEIEHFHIFAC